jgi:hypothetical protein
VDVLREGLGFRVWVGKGSVETPAAQISRAAVFMESTGEARKATWYIFHCEGHLILALLGKSAPLTHLWEIRSPPRCWGLGLRPLGLWEIRSPPRCCPKVE